MEQVFKWKSEFENDSEYVNYNQIRKINGEVLDSFFNYAEPNFNDYSDLLKDHLNNLVSQGKLNIDVYNIQIDGNYIFKLLLYNLINDGKKLSEKYLEDCKFKKKEKIKMLNSIINCHSSIFKTVRKGSKPFKTIIKDIFTNKEYELTDTGTAYSFKFMNKDINESYIITNLFDYDGTYFVDNTLALNKNSSDVRKLIANHRKYNYDFFELWILAYYVSDNAK